MKRPLRRKKNTCSNKIPSKCTGFYYGKTGKHKQIRVFSLKVTVYTDTIWNERTTSQNQWVTLRCENWKINVLKLKMVVIWFVARAPVGRRRRSRDNRKENNIPGQYRDTIIMLHRDRRPGNHFWNHYRFRKLDAWLCVISVFSFVSRVFSIAVRPRSCPFWKREVGKRTRRRPQSPGKNGNHGRRSHTAAYAGRRVRNESQLAGRRS